MPAPLTPLLQTADNVLAMWNAMLLIQVRRGPLTADILDRAAAALQPRFDAGTPAGAMLIMEPGAPLPSGAVKEHQQRTFHTFSEQPAMRIALTILGDGVVPTLSRSVGRVMEVGNRRVGRFNALPDAATWLARELSGLGATVAASHLVTLAEEARRLGLS